jgi:hypothetical protein
LLVSIPCFSVCLRGELEVNGDDFTEVSATRIRPNGIYLGPGY